LVLQYNGIDGCRGGWILASISHEKLTFKFLKSLSEIITNNLLIIDMPVICPETIKDYPRNEDKLAKSYLGNNHASIFYAPVYSWLSQSFSEINQICQNNTKPKLSIQSYNLFKKIIELQLQKNTYQFIESHPECVFKRYNNNRNLNSKKTIEGINQREEILSQHLSLNNLPSLHPSCEIFFKNHKSVCTYDDCLDACVLAILNYDYHIKNTHHCFGKHVIY